MFIRLAIHEIRKINMAEHWNGGNGGKGSKPRPYGVSREVFDNNWDNIFKKDKSKDKNILNKPIGNTHITTDNTHNTTQEK